MDMTQKNLTPTENTSVARRDAPERTMLPPVDVAEAAEGITLRADMPGVGKESLAIDVNGSVLTIEGTVALGESARLSDVYAEIGVAKYKRSFQLSRDLDVERIDARLTNGVLTLHIPKHEKARPRRISVKAA